MRSMDQENSFPATFPLNQNQRPGFDHLSFFSYSIPLARFILFIPN